MRDLRLTNAQKEMMADLINEYAADFPPSIAEMRIDQYKKTQNGLFLAWAGGTEPGSQYYYRIQPPAFLIEYDNTQDGANHVHCVYRDFDNDFGDALLEHYQKQHRQP